MFHMLDYCKFKNASGSMNKLYAYIRSMLDQGVNICGRHYDFLAFSSSQLREHSCWMFASRAADRVSCETIRQWMGDFRQIHPVAKMAAKVRVSSFTVAGFRSAEDVNHFSLSLLAWPIIFNNNQRKRPTKGIIRHY